MNLLNAGSSKLSAASSIWFPCKKICPPLDLWNSMRASFAKKQCLRELIGSAAHIIANCYDQNDENIDAVLDEAEKVIFQISNKRSLKILCSLIFGSKKHLSIFLSSKAIAKELPVFLPAIKN